MYYVWNKCPIIMPVSANKQIQFNFHFVPKSKRSILIKLQSPDPLPTPLWITARSLSSGSWRLFRLSSRPAVWRWAVIVITVQEKGFQVTSPSYWDMWVALIWAVNRSWSASSTIALLTEPVIRKNLDPDWQDICTRTSDNAEWLVPGRVPFCAPLATFQT